jgi:hypothetical protein
MYIWTFTVNGLQAINSGIYIGLGLGLWIWAGFGCGNG